MNRILKLSGVVVGSLLLANCVSPTVYPHKDGSYSLVATSSSSGSANRAAEKKASQVCMEQGKKLEVIHHEEKYQGVDKTAGAAMDIASSLIAGMSGANGKSSKSEDDYKVTLKFRCY